MAAPTLEYSPSFTFQPSSPLDILVRRTSDASKSKNIYASTRYPPSPSYTPHVAPSHRQAHQPPSPLLHTQFRGSTLSAATYDHHNSFLDTTVSTVGSHDSQEVKYRYSGDDDTSVYSTPSILPLPSNSAIIFPDYSTGRPGSWDEDNTPTAASIFVHTEPTPDTGRPSNGESTLESEQGDALPVPTVVITTAIEPASPALTPKRGGKTRIAAPLLKFNFSRPGRPPVLSIEDHKHQVIQRNAHRNRTQAMHPPTIPIPLINYAPPLSLPQHLQVPSARDQHILSQPDSTLNSSRGAEPHRPLVCNNGPESSSSNSSTSSLPYESGQVDHKSLYKSAFKPDMSSQRKGPQSLQPNPYARVNPLHQQQFPYHTRSSQPEGSVGTNAVYSDTPSARTSSYLDSPTPQSSNFGDSARLLKDSSVGNIYSALTVLDSSSSIRPPGPIFLNNSQDYNGLGRSLPTSQASSFKYGKSAQRPWNKLRKPRKPGNGYDRVGHVSGDNGKDGKGKGEKIEKIETDTQCPEAPKVGVELSHDTLSEGLLSPDGHHLTMSSASGLSAGEDLHSSPAHLITNPHGGWLSRSVHPSPSPSSIPPTYHDQSMVASGDTNYYGMPLLNANPKTTHLIPSDGGPPQPNAKPALSTMPDTRASFARDRSPDRGRMSEFGPDSQISSPMSQMSEASNQHSNSPTSAPKEPSTSTTTHRPPKTSVELLREPPPRAVSPAASVYSRYSFYQLDSMSPSPTGSTTRFSLRSPGSFPHSPRFLSPSDPSRLSPTYTREHQVGTRPSSPADTLSPTAPRTAQDYLQLGIQHHEANRLSDSAICFERSAKEAGGCGVGMVMWGLSLRHGWGCEKDEARGFSWLQKAAEGAITDLKSSRKGGLDTCGVQVRLSAFRSLHRC